MSNRIKKYDKMEYNRFKFLSLEDLIIYTIYTLEKNDEPRSLDDISVRALQLFPEKFSMKHYNGHPDVMRVGRETWRLNSKDYLKGSESSKNFTLTEKGIDKYLVVKEKLIKGENDEKNQISTDRRDYYGKLIAYIENNSLYKEYKKRKLAKCIPSHRFKNLLMLPMSASKEEVEMKYQEMLKATKIEFRNDINTFLKICKEKTNI